MRSIKVLLCVGAVVWLVLFFTLFLLGSQLLAPSLVMASDDYRIGVNVLFGPTSVVLASSATVSVVRAIETKHVLRYRPSDRNRDAFLFGAFYGLAFVEASLDPERLGYWSLVAVAVAVFAVALAMVASSGTPSRRIWLLMLAALAAMCVPKVIAGWQDEYRVHRDLPLFSIDERSLEQGLGWVVNDSFSERSAMFVDFAFADTTVEVANLEASSYAFRCDPQACVEATPLRDGSRVYEWRLDCGEHPGYRSILAVERPEGHWLLSESIYRSCGRKATTASMSELRSLAELLDPSDYGDKELFLPDRIRDSRRS